MDDGNVHSSGARVNPVKAELVAVSFVNGLDRVSDVVQKTRESLEAPSLAALGFPALAVVLEGTERDEGVVRGATTKHFCTRVADVRVAHGLLGSAVVVIEFTTKQVQPVLEKQNSVVHEVRGTSLDQEDLLVRKVVRETTGDNTSCSTATNNDKVKVVFRVRRKVCGSHYVLYMSSERCRDRTRRETGVKKGRETQMAIISGGTVYKASMQAAPATVQPCSFTLPRTYRA